MKPFAALVLLAAVIAANVGVWMLIAWGLIALANLAFTLAIPTTWPVLLFSGLVLAFLRAK